MSLVAAQVKIPLVDVVKVNKKWKNIFRNFANKQHCIIKWVNSKRFWWVFEKFWFKSIIVGVVKLYTVSHYPDLIVAILIFLLNLEASKAVYEQIKKEKNE